MPEFLSSNSISEFFSSAMENIKAFWTDFDLKTWAESVGGSSAQAIQAAVYFGLSFAIGFLFKKYFKFLFMTFLVSFFVIAFLHYNKLGVTIDFKAIKTMLGLGNSAPAMSDINILASMFFDWVKSNVLLSVSSVVGFFVGYKLG